MALNWKDNDLEEEQTVADTKKEDLLQPRGLDYGEEETVAFARKSDLVRTLNPRITTLPAGEDLPHTVISERLPLSPALPRDRFAAFLVDTLILAAANLILGRIINHFLLNSQIFGPAFTKYYFIFRTVSLFLFVMLYYVFFESSFGASPGKFLCRLRVVDLDGNTPSLSNVFLRNICRLFDYPLLFLVALLSIEGSRFHQRLGDRAAHTLVIKKTRKKIIPIDLRAAPLSSTFVRLCAFLIDSLFFGTFCWLYLSALNPENAFNPEKKATFQFFFWLFPFLFLSYFSVFEFL
ncbi:MAG: RDD family protein, partial [Deltaproteobacteria bacterium]|nr:RDD family protein [Deltaproteobacteria bacterium]